MLDKNDFKKNLTIKMKKVTVCDEFPYVGKFEKDDIVYHVVFNYDEDWNKEEYLRNNKGMHNNWKYDLECPFMIEFAMTKINQIPEKERTKERVIRHIMFCLNGDNDPNGLFTVKWDNDFSDGIQPNTWACTYDIFYEWYMLEQPLKYGQCHALSECFTAIMRYLNIPCRTVRSENTHISKNNDWYLDFIYSLDINKDGEEDDNTTFCKGDDIILKAINQYIHGDEVDKDCDSDSDELNETQFNKLKLFNLEDGYWNIHFWNEIYTENGWEMVDTSPIIPTKIDDKYKGALMLGPCPIYTFLQGKKENKDFKYLHAAINSPYRIWSIQEYQDEDDNNSLSIPILHSIVYPHHPNKSITINNNKVKMLHFKRPTVVTNKNEHVRDIDISEKYISSQNVLDELFFENHPVLFYFENQRKGNVVKGVIKHEIRCFEKDAHDEYYMQQVFLDEFGKILLVHRSIYKNLYEMTVVQPCENVLKSAYSCSFLLIKVKELKEKKWYIQLLKVQRIL